MRRTNVLCLLLAVAGLSFGIGQSVGQERADAGAQASASNRAIVSQLKRANSTLNTIRSNTASINTAVNGGGSLGSSGIKADVDRIKDALGTHLSDSVLSLLYGTCVGVNNSSGPC